MLNEESEERLRDCFDCTDLNVFTETYGGVNELYETVSEYIDLGFFCERVLTVNKYLPIQQTTVVDNYNKQVAFKDREKDDLN